MRVALSSEGRHGRFASAKIFVWLHPLFLRVLRIFGSIPSKRLIPFT
jgi:hypothetical protein